MIIEWFEIKRFFFSLHNLKNIQDVQTENTVDTTW